MMHGCSSLAQSKDFDDKQFGTLRDGSMGDAGIAMKNNPRFDGDSGQSKKFEGMSAEKSTTAKEAQYTGRQ